MNNAQSRAPRTAGLVRTAIVGLAGARVGVARARHHLQAAPNAEAAQQREAEIGGILLAAMTQLRGTALKAAQVLSLDATFLPAGVRAQLARATHQVTPLNRALVGRVFRQAFACEPENMFKTFEPAAFAAASLGQVHRATLHDGTAVAVKVQYPGMASSIDTDLRLLARALKSLGPRLASTAAAMPEPAVVDNLLADIRTQLLEETDYLLEAQQQHWFKQHTLGQRGDAAARLPVTHLTVADVVHSHSCKTVLTQTLLPGQHLTEWLATAPSQHTRNQQGQVVFDWFMRCALQHGRIHGDLHPGNLLFTPEGGVALLDFGCTRALPASFTQGLARSWCAWLHGKRLAGHAPAATLLHTYRAMGMVAPGLSQAAFEAELLPAIAPVLDWATEPFTAAVFDFASKSLPPVPDARAQQRVAQHAGYVPPEMLALDRAWLGLMHLLRRLGAQVDTRAAYALLQGAASADPAEPSADLQPQPN